MNVIQDSPELRAFDEGEIAITFVQMFQVSNILCLLETVPNSRDLMPLLKRSPFSLLEPPKNLDPNEKVFQISFTREIFRGYQYPFAYH
ncbi:hypothetical protein PR202_ga20266 [Eleusine coracana subsp. coracana]|uniref:Uncharacterized protein n=1 Tax=Eleusine coracana subsp. coracana TaxID=191504 RepID=A0AAV5CY85_ELECO|nr:hypothetical protein PR202_ga20266 [Eleusine coracana subsp. coracana]